MAEKVWVLVANASQAQLYKTAHIGKPLSLLRKYSHPESREKGLDLVADKAGNFNARAGGSGSMIQAEDPRDVEAERFAVELADVIKAGRKTNKFEQLVIFAPSQFQGLLQKHCNSHTTAYITHRVDKDYTNLKPDQLIPHLRDLPR